MVSIKYCPKCNLNLPSDKFHKNRSTATGLAHWCKECRLIWDREHKTDPRRRLMFQRANIKRRENPLTRSKMVWRTARVHAKVKGADFRLSFERVRDAILNGVCERTGVAFDLGFPKTKSVKNPFAPSVDKIDPHGIYEDGNVQIVCWCYNTGKQQMSTNEYEDFILKAAKYIAETRRHA